jgi:uncharacterized protein YqeY
VSRRTGTVDAVTMSHGQTLPERLTADLTVALKARDRAATTALRTTLAALANAEAPAFDPVEHREGHGELVEHDRVVLSQEEEREVVRREVARREALIAEHAGTNVGIEYLDDLRAEVAVLARYLD